MLISTPIWNQCLQRVGLAITGATIPHSFTPSNRNKSSQFSPYFSPDKGSSVSEPCTVALHWQVKAIAVIIQKLLLGMSCCPSEGFIPVRKHPKLFITSRCLVKMGSNLWQGSSGDSALEMSCQSSTQSSWWWIFSECIRTRQKNMPISFVTRLW